MTITPEEVRAGACQLYADRLDKFRQSEDWDRLTPEEQWQVDDAIDLAERADPDDPEALATAAEAIEAARQMLADRGFDLDE